MIVDHHASTAETLARCLQRGDRVAVVTAFSVQEALDVLGATQPDVVLLDLVLSAGSGHALLHRVRQATEAQHVPVLMLTAHPDGPTIRAATRAGATGFIQQPLDAAEVSYKIEQAVRTGRSRAAEDIDLLDVTPPSRACRR